jgi:TPR repeat protein
MLASAALAAAAFGYGCGPDYESQALKDFRAQLKAAQAAHAKAVLAGEIVEPCPRPKLTPESQAEQAAYAKRIERYTEALAVERKGETARAVELYAKLAEARNPHAARRLADIYQNGLIGVPPDPGKAQTWLKVAKELEPLAEKPKPRWYTCK